MITDDDLKGLTGTEPLALGVELRHVRFEEEEQPDVNGQGAAGEALISELRQEPDRLEDL